MNAETVYTVAKALPEKEYIQLFSFMQNDVYKKDKHYKLINKAPVISDKQAIRYFLDHVFNNKNKYS